MNKKYISLLLALILFVTSCVFAEGNEEKEVVRLKKLFSIDDSFDQFDVEKQSSELGEMTGYHWYNNGPGGTNIDILVDDKGEIRSYRKYTEEENKKLYDPQGLEEVADKYLKEIYPKGAKEYIRDDKASYFEKSGQGRFYYQRKVNDLVVLGDTIEININMANKELIGFERSLEIPTISAKDFPKADKSLTEKGKQLFEKELGLVKGFQIFSKGKGLYDEIPYYAMLNENKLIDLKQEKVIRRQEDFLQEEAKEVAADGLSLVEQKGIDKVKDVISKEEAEKRIQEFFPLKGFKLERSFLSKYGEDHIWRMEYMGEKDEGQWASFAIHGKTKALTHLSIPTKNDEKQDPSGTPKVDLSKEVKDFVDKAEKGLEDHLDFGKKEIEGSLVQFIHIPRKEGEFYYFGDGVSLNIHEKTKEIQYYNKEFTPYMAKAPKKDIGLEKAKEIAYKEGKLSTMYMYVDKKPILVFGLENPVRVHMETGKVEGNSGSQKSFIYRDLKDSKYPKEIEILGRYGIGFSGDTWDSKKAITEKDLLTLYNQALYDGGRDLEDMIRIFEKLTGEKYSSDKEVSTFYGTKISFKLNGFKGLDQMKDVFNPKLFKDSGKHNDQEKAYLYSAYAMGLLDREGELKGHDPMTRDDLAHMIYQILNFKTEEFY
ncbi:MAG: hypothetical protein Q4Q07_02415 [Tissierellia bacterium]|nr:hypothetical protein [Tissierellia bacterium]